MTKDVARGCHINSTLVTVLANRLHVKALAESLASWRVGGCRDFTNYDVLIREAVEGIEHRIKQELERLGTHWTLPGAPFSRLQKLAIVPLRASAHAREDWPRSTHASAIRVRLLLCDHSGTESLHRS